jgi:hypothetical protein
MTGPVPRPPVVGAETRRQGWERLPWPRLLVHSAGVRFGMVYAGVFALSTIALAGFLWWSTVGLLDRQTEAAIIADTQGLRERYSDGLLLALEDTIEQRLADNVDDDAVYQLTDPALHPLAGNLPPLPIPVFQLPSPFRLEVERARRRGAVAYVVRARGDRGARCAAC